MELHEFITATLVDIQRGVQGAICAVAAESLSGVINPVWGGAKNISRVNIQSVTFDIAVTASERISGEADGGIKVVGIGVGAKASVADESSRVSRIQFTIPVVPPATTVHDAAD